MRLTSTDFGDGRTDSVRDAIGRAAQRTGVDFAFLLKQAKSESGLNPYARATTSSAGGLYQFIDQSWLGILKQHGEKHGLGWAADAIQYRGGRWSVDPAMRESVFGLRNHPEVSALMAGEFASANAEGLSQSLGRQPSSTDLYFAHFLGLSGATRFLRANDENPDAAAASLFPTEARANRGIFYNRDGSARSLSDVYALMARKIDDDGAAVQMASAVDPARPIAPIAAMAIVPGAVSADHVQLAYAAEVFRDPEDQSTTATMIARARMDILRPGPRQAMLAYMLLAGDGTLGND